MRIETVRKEDEGNYTCIANTRAGIIESTAFINVHVKPSIEVIENMTVLEGVSEVNLLCKATGDPAPIIEWMKAGSKDITKLEGNVKYSIDRKVISSTAETVAVTEEKECFKQLHTVHSSLTIFNPEPTDAGLYKCLATNTAGTDSKSTKLIVEYSPAFRPQSMKVQWSWDQRPVKLFCQGG